MHECYAVQILEKQEKQKQLNMEWMNVTQCKSQKKIKKAKQQRGMVIKNREMKHKDQKGQG